MRERQIVEEKFTELLRWEKRKRREIIVLSAGCYAFVAALLMLPLSGLVKSWISPWWMPLSFVLCATPILLLIERWRSAGPVRTIARLDKALDLEERAITAWEILRRQPALSMELWVVKEAGERLKAFDPRTIFPREMTWQAYVIAPLFALWLGLLWFDITFHGERAPHPSPASLVAQKLSEFGRQLQELAKAEGLRDSLNVGRELEKTAQRRLEGATADDGFKTEVAAAAKKIEDMTRDQESPSDRAATQEGLRDLKTELEVARDGLSFPDGVSGDREIGSDVYERLAGLPHLKKAIEKNLPAGGARSANELKSFLDQLEKDVSRELDRRALLDAQQFLEQMLQQGQTQTGANRAGVPGQSERDSAGEAQREDSHSSFAGTEPGRKEGGSEPPRRFSDGAATHLKGLLGEGSSAGVTLKGKPSPGKAAMANEDVVTSYQRRAEAELNTERVPEALKETIKNYFLSLGMGEQQ
jgi:hypothetical protein